MGTNTLTLKNVRAVDDAGGTHHETIMTAGELVSAFEDGFFRLGNNLRSKHYEMKPGARITKKIDKWVDEILDGSIALGNISMRLDPSIEHDFITDADGLTDLDVMPKKGEALDTSVDAESRIRAILKAQQINPALFNPEQRIAVRIYMCDLDEAHRIAVAYNTRGDRVNDSEAKSAYAATQLERLVAWLVKSSSSSYLSSSNIDLNNTSVSSNSHKLCGYNTLLKAFEQEWRDHPVTDIEVERMGRYISAGWDSLVEVRREFGVVSLETRQKYRRTSVAGSAVSIYGVIGVLFAAYRDRVQAADLGDRLVNLERSGNRDWLDLDMQRWQDVGVVKTSQNSKGQTVHRTINTIQSRVATAKEFKARCAVPTGAP